MPVTAFQARVAKLLSPNKSFDSYLAGGAALHFEPNSIRYSQDLDYFHDSDKRVAESFALDFDVLTKNNIDVVIELRQPGYIRAIARSKAEATKIEWAHDSAWRFMPTYFLEDRGYVLHPIDLAINKVLALAGRDEARDYIDVLHANENILNIAGLVWAACGKDPGFSPHSLLELLQRKGKYRAEDFRRLQLNFKFDIETLKRDWLLAMENVRRVIDYLPHEEVGCLYYNKKTKKFEIPDQQRSKDILTHYATEGGVLPRFV